MSGKELRTAVWPDTHVSEGVLRVYIRALRAALRDDATTPRFIETVAGREFAVAIVAGRRWRTDWRRWRKVTSGYLKLNCGGSKAR